MYYPEAKVAYWKRRRSSPSFLRLSLVSVLCKPPSFEGTEFILPEIRDKARKQCADPPSFLRLSLVSMLCKPRN